MTEKNENTGEAADDKSATAADDKSLNPADENSATAADEKKLTSARKPFLFTLIFIIPVLCTYGWFVNEALRMGGKEELKILILTGISASLGFFYLSIKFLMSKKSGRMLLDARTCFESLAIFIVLLVVLYAFKDFVPTQMLESYSQSEKEIKAGEEAKIGEEIKAFEKNKTVTSDLADRIFITEPKMNHAPVRQESIDALKEAVDALPEKIRETINQFGATITISPNLIDRWPESVDTLPEDSPAPNLAELPGRIYGTDMNIYERKKLRGTTNLSDPRPPSELKHTALNMCIQVYDDATSFTKSEALRKVYNEDKKVISETDRVKLATFMKDDDWGPRETCAETAASLLGGGDEYTEDLYRCFPKTKTWLEQNLDIKTKSK